MTDTLANTILAPVQKGEGHAPDYIETTAPLSPVVRFPTIAPTQLRAARSLLDWSRGELSKESGVSAETIKNIEHGMFIPQLGALKSIFETFAARGVNFQNSPTLNLVCVVLAVPPKQEAAKKEGF